MVRLDWRAALRLFAGFVVGLAVWAFLSPLYDRAVARAATLVLRTFERPPVSRLVPQSDNYVTVDRADFDPRSKRPAIPLRDLTFNFILLTALFAVEARPFSDRNIGGFAIGTLILSLTHVVATVAEVMSIYVAKLGLWSRVNYSDLERNVWGVASHSYRLVLMYAIAFAIWWVCRPSGSVAGPAPAKKRKGRR